MKNKFPFKPFVLPGLCFFVWLGTIIFFMFFYFDSSSAQESDGWEISSSNQLEYSTDRKTHQDIFHNWTDLDLSYGMYGMSLRYEAHQPDDWGKTWQRLSFRNFRFSTELLNITAGNYYVILGRGLILRSYENRDLRFDNNLDGVKGKIDGEGFSLTLLGGTVTGKYERLKDPLQALDGRIAIFDWMDLGGTYLRTHITDFGLVRMFGGNISLTSPYGDLYAEYARKDNPPGQYFSQDGKGFYLSANLYTTGLGLTLEYKDYDKLDFTNQDVTYNNPPALAREHAYTLLNRHAYILDLFDEKGVQAEITSAPAEEVSLVANFSYTTDHQDRLIFSEVYGELEYDYKDKATLKGGISRMESKKEEGSPRRLAPLLDVVYYLSEANSINFVLEHLWTEEDRGSLSFYDQILSLTLSKSSLGSITFTHERTTEWQVREDWSGKRSWFIGTLDLTLGEDHTLSLSIGSRRKGKVCAGGVCVDKPALDGIEIKLLSQF